MDCHVVSFLIVDKSNDLIFYWSSTDNETQSDKVYLQTIVYSSLDIALEKRKR